MEGLEDLKVKQGFATQAVPPEELAGVSPMTTAPRVGDLVVAEVLSVGKNKTIEERTGRTLYLFPGDVIVGSFGNRYATDQFEGYVPQGPVDVCDMLSVGGVCGEVVSQHDSTANPTKLRVRGLATDKAGQPINSKSYGLPYRGRGGGAEVISVVGSAMDSGKTTTAGTLVRSLSRCGYRVAAAKVTGTAAGKDGRFMESSGASPVLDFTSAGYPSTYMLDPDEILTVYQNLLGHLDNSNPDYIVLEIADGIFQRETRMLLGSEAFRRSVDHLFFAAGDSLAVESGVRFLKGLGMPLRATAGAVTQSSLAVAEAEEATAVPCMGIERMMTGELPKVVRATGKPMQGREVHEPALMNAV